VVSEAYPQRCRGKRGAIGRRSAASRGCLIRSCLARFVTTRYGLYTKLDRWIFVARRKRQRTRGSSAQRCQGLARVGKVGWVPLGVVPPPSAGASFARASRDSLPRATVVHEAGSMDFRSAA